MQSRGQNSEFHIPYKCPAKTGYSRQTQCALACCPCLAVIFVLLALI